MTWCQLITEATCSKAGEVRCPWQLSVPELSPLCRCFPLTWGRLWRGSSQPAPRCTAASKPASPHTSSTEWPPAAPTPCSLLGDGWTVWVPWARCVQRVSRCSAAAPHPMYRGKQDGVQRRAPFLPLHWSRHAPSSHRHMEGGWRAQTQIRDLPSEQKESGV